MLPKKCQLFESMQKEDWIRLALPASISLLAIAITTSPLIAVAAGIMRVEGVSVGPIPIEVRIVN